MTDRFVNGNASNDPAPGPQSGPRGPTGWAVIRGVTAPLERGPSPISA
ncbi:MAG: hypothetical protein CM15mP18_1590 [Methanobacteriota archaeon]|nr:MAG: hypothetical protein CM15mP18_1590 [Euryarchaeota archaeon]